MSQSIFVTFSQEREHSFLRERSVLPRYHTCSTVFSIKYLMERMLTTLVFHSICDPSLFQIRVATQLNLHRFLCLIS